MQKVKAFQRSSFTAFLLLAMVLGSVLIASAQSKTQPVVVTNTRSQAVPTVAQGTTVVSVANTPAVNIANAPNVNVANTPNVAITNTPAVSIANNGANPVPVNVRIQPWQVFLEWLNNGTAGMSGYVVPEGKRVVIEYANVHAILGTWIDTSDPSNPRFLPEVMLSVSQSGQVLLQLELGPTGRVIEENNRFYAASLPMKLYVEPGQFIQVWNNSTLSASAWVFLSGYQEDVQ